APGPVSDGEEEEGNSDVPSESERSAYEAPPSHSRASPVTGESSRYPTRRTKTRKQRELSCSAAQSCPQEVEEIPAPKVIPKASKEAAGPSKGKTKTKDIKGKGKEVVPDLSCLLALSAKSQFLGVFREPTPTPAPPENLVFLVPDEDVDSWISMGSFKTWLLVPQRSCCLGSTEYRTVIEILPRGNQKPKELFKTRLTWGITPELDAFLDLPAVSTGTHQMSWRVFLLPTVPLRMLSLARYLASNVLRAGRQIPRERTACRVPIV
ncbi:hypothetical protein BDP27DRAFT_1378478, partial [Rhodocollybia butyracea]